MDWSLYNFIEEVFTDMKEDKKCDEEELEYLIFELTQFKKRKHMKKTRELNEYWKTKPQFNTSTFWIDPRNDPCYLAYNKRVEEHIHSNMFKIGESNGCPIYATKDYILKGHGV